MALVLSRKSGESLIINNNIKVTTYVHNGKVRLVIDAPREVKVVRSELERKAA